MFDNEPENKWIAKISAEVSALANTEGGELFLGIETALQLLWHQSDFSN